MMNIVNNSSLTFPLCFTPHFTPRQLPPFHSVCQLEPISHLPSKPSLLYFLCQMHHVFWDFFLLSKIFWGVFQPLPVLQRLCSSHNSSFTECWIVIYMRLNLLFILKMKTEPAPPSRTFPIVHSFGLKYPEKVAWQIKSKCGFFCVLFFLVIKYKYYSLYNQRNYESQRILISIINACRL